MSKTPSKNDGLPILNFKPKEILSPNKDAPGISKTVYTHLSRLHNLLMDWRRIQDGGTKICKTVLALKLHECNDDFYPSQLGPLCDSLITSVDSLGDIVEGVKIINNQLKAATKIQKSSEPIILTWSAKQISDEVERILVSLKKEYSLKKTISENIAHCRVENLIETYVAAWEFEPYFDVDNTSYLFAEVGLSALT